MSLRVPILVASLLLAACADDHPAPPQVAPERWIAQELGTAATFRDVFFLDELHGWIVGGGHLVEGGIVGRTEDGGRTWSFASGIARPSRRATSFYLNAVWFVDERNGFIAADGGQILRSVDRGEHWHAVRTNHRVWAHVYDLQFVDARHGWAIGSGGLQRTTDGGDSWRGTWVADDDELNSRPIRGRALHFVDNERGWVVGRAGSILRSTDGGESWTPVGGETDSGRPDLWGLDFVDADRGWVVGNRGTIRHTADGGESWQTQSSGVVETLTDVDFIDRARGWAVGFERERGSSVVLRTTDGGAGWSEQARIGSEAMRALFVLNETNAWALGEQQRRGDDDGAQKLLRYEVTSPR